MSEMKADKALSIVVLPEPVPPEMIVVTRAFTAAASNSAICGRSAPISTSLFRLNGFLENLRIETSGPSTPTGPHRDVHARAVEQARVAKRMRFIHAPADRGDDFVDDAQKMQFILEAAGDRLKHAPALNVNILVSVDQNIADRSVLEQRLERTEAGHFVDDFGDEVVQFLLIEREALIDDVLADQLLHVLAHLVLGKLFQRGQIELFQQAAMQPHFGVKQLVGLERARRNRGRHCNRRLALRLLRKHRPGHAFQASAGLPLPATEAERPPAQSAGC